MLTEGDGRWTDAEEKHIPELDGCFDVDIQWSPLTNSLPVNRIRLQQGEPQEIRVAYISLPDLALTVVSQSYERIGDSSVQYASEMSSRAHTIDIDEDGIVTNYPERFSRTWPR